MRSSNRISPRHKHKRSHAESAIRVQVLTPGLRSFRPFSLLRDRGSLKAASHLSLLRHYSSRPRCSKSTPISSQSHPWQHPHPHAVYELPPGSLSYAAPELLRTPDVDHPYCPHPTQDVWALGVILYVLLTGGLPLSADNENLAQYSPTLGSSEIRLLTNPQLGAIEIIPQNVGRGAELVLCGCLEASVTQRWTMAAFDDVSRSVGWDTDTDNSCSGLVECEFERMVHETRTFAQGPASRSASCAHSVISKCIPCEDAGARTRG